MNIYDEINERIKKYFTEESNFTVTRAFLGSTRAVGDAIEQEIVNNFGTIAGAPCR